METMSGAGSLSTSKLTVVEEELARLPGFFSASGDAISFYLGWPEVRDNSHRDEAIAAKNLVQRVTQSATGSLSASVLDDLRRIRKKMEEVRSDSNRLRTVFACGDKGLWREFDLPCRDSCREIYLGQYLRAVPLMTALQKARPYGVVLMETGKARVFLVRGADVEEIPDAIGSEDLSLHPDDSRVGWSSHIDENRREHERAFLERAVQQMFGFTEKKRLNSLIVGCREEVWAHIGPLLGHSPKVAVGRFHLPTLALVCGDVPKYAKSSALLLAKKKFDDVLYEVNESPSTNAVGPGPVIASLHEGSARVVVLGSLADEVASECRTCGYIRAGESRSCEACGGELLGYQPMDEAVLRMCISSGAELILAAVAGAVFHGVAALLRYPCVTKPSERFAAS
jgi:hypothetical protein